jgi:hypothetical protein
VPGWNPEWSQVWRRNITSIILQTAAQIKSASVCQDPATLLGSNWGLFPNPEVCYNGTGISTAVADLTDVVEEWAWSTWTLK